MCESCTFYKSCIACKSCEPCVSVCQLYKLKPTCTCTQRKCHFFRRTPPTTSCIVSTRISYDQSLTSYLYTINCRAIVSEPIASDEMLNILYIYKLLQGILTLSFYFILFPNPKLSGKSVNRNIRGYIDHPQYILGENLWSSISSSENYFLFIQNIDYRTFITATAVRIRLNDVLISIDCIIKSVHLYVLKMNSKQQLHMKEWYKLYKFYPEYNLFVVCYMYVVINDWL